jgi:eukaryotic-like serine/threonine-protein kinase
MAANEARLTAAALKATLIDGTPAVERAIPSVAATLRGVGDTPMGSIVLDDVPDEPSSPALASRGVTAAGRTTVLPRRNRSRGVTDTALEQRARFDRVRLLGQGAMGEVELARDNDIRRTVAVKRVLADASSPAALMRFADEVRIVGQLEHPSIVPVYDVGRDADGQVYLVMKHLHGETMESIIEKLRARDPAYEGRFTIEYRLHLYLGVLDAIRYAHARGILHRDLKPANIMIGPFGEVTVLDWGIAKPIRPADPSVDVAPLERTLVDSHDQRLLETKLGSLAGTPLYMSPEQAAGRNDDLDARSDIYTLCVLLFEWLVLEHPLRGKETVTEVLAAIIAQDYPLGDLFERAGKAGVPMEYVWLILRGVAREREKRYPSVNELEEALKRAMDGKMKVQCHVTLAKRSAHAAMRWIDRHQRLYMCLFFASVLAVVAGLGAAVWLGVRALL